MKYPTTFAESLTPLPEDLGKIGNESAAVLADKGYIVMAGLTKQLRSEYVDGDLGE